MTDEQRQEMRERFQNMTDEERASMRQQFAGGGTPPGGANAAVGAANATAGAATTTSRVNVEVGINNEDYIEIVSGLKEGDLVVLPTSASTSNSNNRQAGFGSFGSTTIIPGGGGFGGGGFPGGGAGGGFQGGGTRAGGGTGAGGGGGR